jgi:hypothetical protein
VGGVGTCDEGGDRGVKDDCVVCVEEVFDLTSVVTARGVSVSSVDADHDIN